MPPIGFEPISLSTEVFETSVFTNFTTGAFSKERSERSNLVYRSSSKLATFDQTIHYV